MYIYIYAPNRKGIRVKIVRENGLKHFLWHITGRVCIPEDVVAISYIW